MATIRERIIASPELQAARAARDLDALAAGLNAQGVTEIGSRFVNMRTIAAECGADADAMIAAITAAAPASPALTEMLCFMRRDSGIDVGLDGTRARIDELLVAGAFTPEQADRFKALALRPLVVTRADVEAAMYNPDGTEK